MDTAAKSTSVIIDSNEEFDVSDAEKSALFSPNSVENQPVKEDRTARKGRKPTKNDHNFIPVVCEESVGVAGLNLSSSVGRKHFLSSAVVGSKNNRRRRNIKARGEPKKGGGGGKGVWGKPGSELDETGVCNDFRDPNYDSDSQEEYKLEEVDPVLNESQLEVVVKPIIEEYFEHGNTVEVEDLLLELNIGPNKYVVAKLAIILAMDRHNAHRELTSRLLSDLHGSIFSETDMAMCFDSLLSTVEDLLLDTPEAPNLLGQFIARCVADDCLPPKYIYNYKGKVNCNFVKDALEKAEVLLSMNHGIAHLDSIWGFGGGNRPVTLLTNKMLDLLKEYFNSGDINEARRCLLELEVPHFHHELVYQACDLAIEDSSDRVIDMAVLLLKNFTSTLVVTIDQFEKGIKRLYSEIDEICVDVPAGYKLLDQLVNKLRVHGVLSEEIAACMPSRSRRRFVSEGDIGKMRKDLSLR